jgi:DNA mismatch repair protein MLH3
MLTSAGTSKYHANERLLGRNGTFLASLAALSLLTIASHHHEYHSQNAITFHHSRVVERQLPAPAHHEVHGKHGTRVTVRNLFGNMPVRVKQRAVVATQKEELEKLWGGLKHDIVGLLLSWQGTVSVRVRDSENKTIFNLNTSGPSASVRADKNTEKACSVRLYPLLNVLTQASYIAIDEWPSWVPASASTSTISVKGAISLDPAPSKHVQFISLGLQPLSSNYGYNEIFDHINRLFALSSFGTVEEEAAVDDAHDKMRRQLDRRFKKDGYTNRQLKARKDVDRYPMFYLRVSLTEANERTISEDQLMGDQANLQNVLDILEAMIMQWLVVHHFRPRQPRKSRDVPGTASSSFSEAVASDSSATQRHVSASQLAAPRSNSTAILTRKRKRSKDSISREQSGKHHRAFAEWSRIKSGKSEFFNSLPARPKPKTQIVVNKDVHSATQRPTGTESFASFTMKPIPQGAFNVPTIQARLPTASEAPSADEKENDDSILWKDLKTGNTHVLNARTGCAMSNVQSRPNTDSSTSIFGPDQKSSSKSIRLPNRASTAVVKPTPWLDDVLQNWENPVFQPSEQRIQQIPIDENKPNHDHDHSIHDCSRLASQALDANTTSISSKLSKESLQNAQVISQVDKKFILVKMKNTSHSHDHQADDMLVLIDQHAADERVQVESLFEQLCTPLPSGADSYQSQLGHKSRVASVTLEKPLNFAISAQEHSLFITHAARFATWGILYDVPINSSQHETQKNGRRESLVSVTTLPPTIAQRCIADPRILISLLRSTVWSYAEHGPVLPAPAPHIHSSLEEEGEGEGESTAAEKTSWVRHLSTCPAALVNLINSRACRSAVMFNDELNLAECIHLVGKLARCVFPFMCAHGRPSMVPLVGLGERGWEKAGSGLGGSSENHKSFVQAWKDWRG